MNAIATMFEGNPLTFTMFRGAPVVSAGEVGQALGYSPGRLGDTIVDEWADDFREGRDFHRLSGDALAEFKAIDRPRDSRSVAPNTRALLVLTESGLYLVSLRSPKGTALRQWLADEVLPKLARGQAVGGRAASALASESRNLRLLGDRLRKSDPRRAAALYDQAATLAGIAPVDPKRLPASDSVDAFLAECCRRGTGELALASDLLAAFNRWSPGRKTTPHELGAGLRRAGLRPHPHNGEFRMWTGLSLNDDPHIARVLAWIPGREFTLRALRAETRCPFDGRCLGVLLRREGYEPHRVREPGQVIDMWRKVIA